MNQYFPITKRELSLIKNDCYHPETISCDGCEFACHEMGCSWMGANALEEEILTRNPYQSERGDCNSMGCCEFCNKDGCWYLSAICKKKRDKALDNLEKVLREYEDVRFVDVVCEIDKLRQAGEP